MRFQELPLPEPQPDDVRGRADDIMARAEFNESESILDRLGRWLEEALGEIFQALSGGGAGTVVAWVIMAAAIAAAAFLVTKIRRPTGLVRHKSTEVSVVTQSAVLEPARSADEWRSLADIFAGEGNFDEALRARYRGLLAALFDGGVLEDVAGRTPGEYRAEMVAQHPAASASFGALTDRFEQVWYSPDVASSDDLVRFGQAEAQVLGALAPAETGTGASA